MLLYKNISYDVGGNGLHMHKSDSLHHHQIIVNVVYDVHFDCVKISGKIKMRVKKLHLIDHALSYLIL